MVPPSANKFGGNYKGHDAPWGGGRVKHVGLSLSMCLSLGMATTLRLRALAKDCCRFLRHASGLLSSPLVASDLWGDHLVPNSHGHSAHLLTARFTECSGTASSQRNQRCGVDLYLRSQVMVRGLTRSSQAHSATSLQIATWSGMCTSTSIVKIRAWATEASCRNTRSRLAAPAARHRLEPRW